MARLNVYKSTAAEFLDDFLGGSPEELARQYQWSLDLIESVGDGHLSDAAARLAEDGELPNDAVEDSRKGWRGDEVVDRIIGHAYREAIRLAGDGARGEPVPVDTLWMTGATDAFEAHIVDGPRRVTVVLCIPLERSYGSRRARSRSWSVRAGDDGEVVMEPTSGEEQATSA